MLTVKIFILDRNKTGTPQKIVDCSSFVPYQHCFGGVSVPCQKKTRSATNFFCPKMHYAPGWGGNGDKNSTPTELFWAGTKLGHPQKPQVFQFCSGPVYFCLRIVTAQNKYFYGMCCVHCKSVLSPFSFFFALTKKNHTNEIYNLMRFSVSPNLDSIPSPLSQFSTRKR